MAEYSPRRIGSLYDAQARSFDSFAYQSYNWETLEKPCIVKNLAGLVGPTTKIVDLACGSARLGNVLVDMGADPKNILTLFNPNVSILLLLTVLEEGWL